MDWEGTEGSELEIKEVVAGMLEMDERGSGVLAMTRSRA